MIFQYLACFLSLAFGVFVFTVSFAEDMNYQLNSIIESAATKQPESNIFKQLAEFIAMNVAVIQLSCDLIHDRVKLNMKIEIQTFYFREIHHFSKVYQTTIAILFSGSIIAICMALLLIQVNIVKCPFVAFFKDLQLIRFIYFC